jgi:hypothetical protein
MEQSLFSRWLSRAFLRPVVYAEAVITTALVAGLAVDYLMPELVFGVLLWTAPLAALVSLAAVSCLHAAYSLRRGSSRQARLPKQPTAPQERSARISFAGWEAVEAPLTPADGEAAWLSRLNFTSEPDPQAMILQSPSVAAIVEFYDGSGESLQFAMVGQWASGLPDMATGAQPEGTNTIEIPLGGPPSALNIALKYDQDEECYGFNHETPGHASDDWRDRQKRLEPGEWIVKVVIYGTSLEETFWFKLVNRGAGHRARVVPLSLR